MIFTGCICLSIDFIRPCCHDEVIFVQAADLMGPPLQGDTPPLGDDQGMVVFFFGNGTYLVREFQRRDYPASTITWTS